MTIKSWSSEDRPREKLLEQSAKALSNAELLAIILGSGSRDENAVSLAKRILADLDNQLIHLIQSDIHYFKTFKGIGDAKAVTIIAALELAYRIKTASPIEENIITSSQAAYNILHPHLAGLAHEEFWILILNRKGRLLSKYKISQGGVSATVVDNKLILKKAIEHLASSIIVAHNHPSGSLKPSKQDIQTTQKLSKACKSLDISLLDHLIITNTSYYSFKDEDLLP